MALVRQPTVGPLYRGATRPRTTPSRPIEPDIHTALAEETGRRPMRANESVEFSTWSTDELTPETGAVVHRPGRSIRPPSWRLRRERFDDAFDRWRDLFAAAEEQRDAARKTMDDYSASYQDKRAAQTRHAQAVDQLNLLQRGTSAFSSDFFTYRYLATEGFLPGLQLPEAAAAGLRSGQSRWPWTSRRICSVRGSLRSRSLGRAASSITRDALIGSCGHCFRLAHRESATPDTRNCTTKAVRVCMRTAGRGTFGDDRIDVPRLWNVPGRCAEVVGNTYRIENVATYPAEHITANDEERQRQGFDLQTTFEWAIRDQEVDVTDARRPRDARRVRSRTWPTAPVRPSRASTRGCAAGPNKTFLGFHIDPVSGYWAKNEEEDTDEHRARSHGRTPAVDRPERPGPQRTHCSFRPVGDGLFGGHA